MQGACRGRVCGPGARLRHERRGVV